MNMALCQQREFSGVQASIARVLLVLLVAALSACGDSHLRGSVEPSEDGKTYLVIADDSGGACGPIRLNGKVWPHAKGVAGEIEPGTQTIECGAALQFDVPEGVVFTFDYWGP